MKKFLLLVGLLALTSVTAAFANTYSVKTTLFIPDTMIAKAKTERLLTGPSGGPRGGQRSGGIVTKNSLTFRDTNFKVVFEVIDNETQEVVKRESDQLQFYFSHNSEIQDFSWMTKGHINILEQNGQRPQDININGVKIVKGPLLAGLSAHRVILREIDNEVYEISNIKFDNH
jgi:cytochrome c-type biogenesis protein CcmE